MALTPNRHTPCLRGRQRIGQLVEFVRRVLQVIPASMFDILKEIIGIQTNRLQEVPTRLEKDHLKECARRRCKHGRHAACAHRIHCPLRDGAARLAQLCAAERAVRPGAPHALHLGVHRGHAGDGDDAGRRDPRQPEAAAGGRHPPRARRAGRTRHGRGPRLQQGQARRPGAAPRVPGPEARRLPAVVRMCVARAGHGR